MMTMKVFLVRIIIFKISVVIYELDLYILKIYPLMNLDYLINFEYFPKLLLI